MNYSPFYLILCCLFVSLVPGSTETDNEKIQKFLKEKIDSPNYDKRVFPDGNDGPGTPVQVNVSMYFLDISNMDEHNMEFDAQFYFRQSWVDPRLQHTGLTVDRIVLTDVDKIWTPDLFIVHEKKGEINKITQPNILARISPNGFVLYSIRVYEKISCNMDLRNYPLDTQKCVIRLESYAFRKKEVVLNWSGDYPVGTTELITAIDYDLIEISQKRDEQAFSTGTYSLLEVHLTLKRKTGFFTKRMYLPFTFLVLLSWLSFWIRTEERCLRLGLLLTIMYLMVTMTSDLDRWIPVTSYTKASDVWIGFCDAFVFAAVLEFVAVAIFFRREPTEDNSWGKIEMSPILDNEAKETNLNADSLKLLLNQISHKTDSRSGEIGRARFSSNFIDRISRFAFPIVFLLFNIVYWSVYA